MSPTHCQFATHDLLVPLNFEPCADGIAIGAVLLQLECQPMTWRFCGVTPDLRPARPVNHQEINLAIKIEIHKGAATRLFHAVNAGLVTELEKSPSSC